MISGFIPTLHNTTSGFLIMLPPEGGSEMDMIVEEVLKMIMSLGLMMP